jgi:aminocarboxymuconate-semialdehyde decarboxylase
VTTRASALWCDSLAYEVGALLLAAQAFTAPHIVLGTDYPFDARERPAGATAKRAQASGRLGQAVDIVRANVLALLDPNRNASDRGAPWHVSSASV